MTDQERTRLEELRQKAGSRYPDNLGVSDRLDERELRQFQVLYNMEDAERRSKEFWKRQAWPYDIKVGWAKSLIEEFIRETGGKCYVAVGGLDSITLLLLIRSMGYDAEAVPAVSVSALEDKSIQVVHRALGVQPLKPTRPKVAVIREFGWPVISKEVAGKISQLQHPSEKNATIRHAIITGETGAQGGYRTGTRMQLKQKWLKLFGGYENENEGTDYQTPDFLVSERCCYYLKEKPCNDYAKETGRFPFMGLMASEGGEEKRRSRSMDAITIPLQPPARLRLPSSCVTTFCT